MTNEQPQHIDPLWQDFERTAPTHPAPSGETTGATGEAQPEPGETIESAGGVQPELTQDELDKRLTNRTYVGRFATDTDVALADTFSAWDGLRARYGKENVLVSGISIDPDTQQKVHVPGKLGMWVDTEAKRAIDEAQQQA